MYNTWTPTPLVLITHLAHSWSCSIKLFEGNSGTDDEVYIDLENVTRPLVTRFIRIHPVDFHGRISLRFDVHGCKYFEDGSYLHARYFAIL